MITYDMIYDSMFTYMYIYIILLYMYIFVGLVGR